MCFFQLLLDAILLKSSNIALSFSWNRTLSSMVKPCTLIQYWFHSIWGLAYSAPINSASIEILELILCFFEIPVMEPLTSDIVDLVCYLISGFSMYEVLNHHLITVSISALRISSRLIVIWKYCRTRFNLPQLYSSGLFTVVVRKNCGLDIFPLPWARK